MFFEEEQGGLSSCLNLAKKKVFCQKKSKKYDTFLPLFFSRKKALFSFFLLGGGVVVMGLRSPLRKTAADDDVGLKMDAKRASSCCGRGKRAFSTSVGIRAASRTQSRSLSVRESTLGQPLCENRRGGHHRLPRDA